MIRATFLSTMIVAGVLSAPTFAEDTADVAKPVEKDQTDKADKAEKPKRAVKLPGLWGKLKDVSDEQKAKINAIRRKALADKRKIDEQEEADILATLTDEQKKEYETLKEELAAKRKEGSAKKKADGETTDDKKE